jgi:hypothetical protein
MGRIIDYQAAPETIAASTTVTFTSAKLPGSGVVRYMFGMTGAGNTLNAIDRIRVKANGVPFYDISTGLYRAFIQRFTGGVQTYPPNTAIPPPPGAAATPVDWRRFSIPFHFLDREKSEEADVCQFPVGAQPTVEIVFNANAVAGSIYASWMETDVQPRCYPKLYSNQMNIAASNVNGRYPFSEDGVLRGFGVETTGLGRFRAVLNGRQVIHNQCQPANSTTVTEDAMLLEQEFLGGGRPYALLAGGAASDDSIIDPAWMKLTTGDDATPGRSFIELGTLAAWSGVSSELGIYAVKKYDEGDAG